MNSLRKTLKLLTRLDSPFASIFTFDQLLMACEKKKANGNNISTAQRRRTVRGGMRETRRALEYFFKGFFFFFSSSPSSLVVGHETRRRRRRYRERRSEEKKIVRMTIAIESRFLFLYIFSPPRLLHFFAREFSVFSSYTMVIRQNKMFVRDEDDKCESYLRFFEC